MKLILILGYYFMTDWDDITVGNIGDKFYSGGTPSTTVSEFWNGDIPWITSKWLNDKLYLENGEKFITDIAINGSSTKIVPAGNLIFATRVGVGKVSINKIDIAINQDLLGIEIDKTKFDPAFIAYQLRSNDIQMSITSFKRGATIQGITKDNFKSIPLKVPPLPEQRKIAAVLSTVQKAIETQTKLIERITELKKAMMHKLFTKGTRGEKQKMTEIGPVPESWEVKTVEQFVSYIDYGVSQAIPKVEPKDGVKIVSTADITKTGKLLYNKIRKIEVTDKTKERLTLKDGDVLFNWRNSAELIGKSTIFKEQREQHIFASFILRMKCDEENSHNRFFCYLMNYYRETEVFLKLARRAVNQANYNKNEISVLKMIAPSHKEQIEIADTIEKTDNKIDLHSNKKQMLEELFRTLLHKLMTAEIRVDEIDLDGITIN